jgi:ATP-binding cassette, subfamily B (MDR/TAP), member 7
LLNVQVPIFFKNIIDSLNISVSAEDTVWLLAGSAIVACSSKVILVNSDPDLTTHLDGTARIGATVFNELLSVVFARVGQKAVRKVARETFEHLLNLDLKFHLSRQTGGLTRAIDRGTK